MNLLGLSREPDTEPTSGASYLFKLHKYLSVNRARLAPSPKSSTPDASFLSQSYTLLTLGLDPKSAPLNRNVKVPLTLGFGTPSPPTKTPLSKPLLLRLPPDRLLYLLLRWQSLPQSLPHVGRTDVPIESGVPVAARGAKADGREKRADGDVQSVRSWVGSMRSVSLGSMASAKALPGMGWYKKTEVVNEDEVLLALYSMFTVLPALLIHPPFLSDQPIAELIEAGGYTQLGGIDVRVPLDVVRNLQILELEGYDPRGLLIPPNPGLRSLTVRDVQDADDWLEDLLSRRSEPDDEIGPRFPNLRHLSLHSTTLLSFPILPLDRLTHLDLSFNLLNAIPSTLSSIPSLRSLNLSNNLITSLRNAPSALGNSTSLNLSRNRIDCLVGLERVLALERIDVRANELAEADEVGRLAVLPHVREVWCANNLFDRPSVGDEWRIELGAAYAAEGRAEVVFDDQPWTWAESRRIESLLSSRGKTSHSHLHGTESSHRPQTSSKLPTPNPTTSLSATETGVTNPTLSALPLKKRRPRRVINLEDPNSQSEEDEPTSALVGGSLRLPESTGMIEDRKERGSTFRVDRRKERRARVSASMFEPNTGGLDGKG